MKTATAEELWTPEKEAAYQALANEAKARFNAAQGAWVAFVTYLRAIELTDDWRRPDYNHFSDFLRAEFPAAFGYERYSNLIKAVEVYGRDFMERMDPDASHCLTTDRMLMCPGAVTRVKEWCELHFGQHGVMPEHNTILGYTKRATEAAREAPRLVRQDVVTRQLRSENATLRRVQVQAEKALSLRDGLVAENARLRAELKAAKQRIRELERQLARAQKEIVKRERSGSSKIARGARSSSPKAKKHAAVA